MSTRSKKRKRDRDRSISRSRSYSRSRSRSRSRDRRKRRRRRKRKRERRRRYSSSEYSDSSSNDNNNEKNHHQPTQMKIIKATAPNAFDSLSVPSINNAIIDENSRYRPARRLYVGNLPVCMGLTEQILLQFFSQCCKGLGIATLNPVLSVWLNAEQTFGFIEFRSVQDTDLSLKLFEGLNLGGRQLRFGRPIDYVEPPELAKNFVVGGEDGSNEIEKGSPAQMLLIHGSKMKIKQNINSFLLNQNNENSESNVLLLMDIFDDAMLKAMDEDKAEYADIVDDIECECENYGNLKSVIVPKRNEKGFGRVFLQFETIKGAKKCKTKVDGRKFGESTVKCVYFKEALFDEKEFDCNMD